MPGDYMSAFRSRFLVLRAIERIPQGNASLSRISREANLSPVVVKQHLAFLQVKDYVTVSDFTVENRESLKRRATSGTPYLLTPSGKSLLSKITKIMEEITSDKLVRELETVAEGSAILTE